MPALDSAAQAHEDAAHRLYVEARDPAAALVQWRVRGALGPPTIASQLALAHCEIELGTDMALPDIGVAQPDCPRGERAAEYAEFILACAWTHFRNSDQHRAAKLTRLVAAVDPHFRSVYEQQILAPASAYPAAIPSPPDAAEPLPFERDLRLTGDAARALVARHAHRRVLLFMPQYSGAPDALLERIPCRQLRVTLAELGIGVMVVESQRLSAEEHLRLHDTLRQAIATFQPDVIVCYDAMVSGATGFPDLQDGIASVLLDARRTLGSKLVFSYSDAWYDGFADLFEALVDVPDLFHVHFSGLIERLSPAVAAKTLCLTYPFYDPRPSGTSVPVRHGRAAFVGGVNWANLSRLVWCAEIERAGLPVDVRVTGNTAGDTQMSLSDYADLIASYPISVNLVARASGDRIYTGRTSEAPLFGSLLLEEASDDTAYYLRPYEHFVPFHSLAQLGERLQILLDDAPLRERITRAGAAWVKRQFSAAPFWARLFWRLYETDAARLPPPPGGGIRAVKVRFPHSAQSYLELARPLRPIRFGG